MSDEELSAGAMTFWEHLEELRSRIIRSLFAFLVGAVAAWWYKEQLLIVLTQPFVDGWPGKATAPALHFPAPHSLFIAYIKLSALGGALLALPFVLYQVWAFVSPGLYSREKKYAIPFVVSSCGLFAAGAYFGWRLVFPLAFDYLLNFTQLPLDSKLHVEATVMVDEYLSFITHGLLAFGLVFEIPVLIFFLSVAGLVTHRHLLKFFRYFIVIAFVIAAVITPPDPLSQIMLAIPLILLYGVGILIAWVFARKREKAAD